MIDAADLSKIDNPNIWVDERTGGLLIHNIRDLTIADTGQEKANILTGNMNADVIVFEDSQGISLADIRAGHKNEDKGCFRRSSDIYLEDCSFYIMCLSNSDDIEFFKSSFHDNKGTTLINISGCGNVVFEKCEIIDNAAVTDTAALFALDMSEFSPYVRPFERNGKDSLVRITDTVVQKHIVRTAPGSRAVIEYINVSEPEG